MNGLAGLAIGATTGSGLALLLAATTDIVPETAGRAPTRRATRRLDELAGRAGASGLDGTRVLAICAGAALVAAFLGAAVSRSAVIGLAFAVVCAWLPVAVLRHRAEVRGHELRALWPDVVDDLASAVRAGLALPEALAHVGSKGPAQLREPFEAFARDYAVSGRFGDALDGLKQRLADPVGDRVVESLRLAREVGGSDLGRLLRTVSAALRDDARIRGELETRQGWTVNAARLAAAAPWFTLAFLSLRPEAVRAYDSVAGACVLAAGGGATLVAYRLMLRIGRLPLEPRVLR